MEKFLANFNLGNKCFEKGDYNLAIDHYELCLKFNKNNTVFDKLLTSMVHADKKIININNKILEITDINFRKNIIIKINILLNNKKLNSVLDNTKYYKLFKSGYIIMAIESIDKLLNKSKDSIKLNYILHFFNKLIDYYTNNSNNDNNNLIDEPKNIKSLLYYDGIINCLKILKKTINYNSKKLFDIYIINIYSKFNFLAELYNDAVKGYLFLYNIDKNSFKYYLSLCFTYLNNYQHALDIDIENKYAWLLYKPSDPILTNIIYKNIINLSKNDILPLIKPFNNQIILEEDELNVILLYKAKITGYNPIICNNQYYYIGNRMYLDKKELYNKILNKHTKSVESGITILSTNSNNYNHMILETIIRLNSLFSLASKDIIKEFENIPLYVCLDYNTYNYLKCMLNILEINIKINNYNVNDIIYFKKLYIIDVNNITNYSNKKINEWHKILPHKKSILSFRNTILNKINPQKPNKFIYLVRIGKINRSIIDDNNLYIKLEKWASQNELEFICINGKFSNYDEIKLFSEAKIIMGINGSGFVNMIYAPTNCIILEIPLFYNSNNIYQEISHLLNFNYLNSNLQIGYYDILEKINDSDVDNIINILNINYKK